MNNTVLSKNLKKLRLEKNLTQENVAATLGLNPQTVSRWECGVTLPDVLTLPEMVIREHFVAWTKALLLLLIKQAKI